MTAPIPIKPEQRGASSIETLRLALGSGASAITQLAAAVTGQTRSPRPDGDPARDRASDRSDAGRISVDSFVFPYFPGFPVLAYPGRKPLAPAYTRKSSFLR